MLQVSILVSGGGLSHVPDYIANAKLHRLEKIEELGLKTVDEDGLVALIEAGGSKKRPASDDDEDDEDEEEEEEKPKKGKKPKK